MPIFLFLFLLLDIDECADKNAEVERCDEDRGLKCFNLPGSFECRCDLGYLADSHGICTGWKFVMINLILLD